MARVAIDGGQVIALNGVNTVNVPTGAGSTTVKATPGRLCRILVTTTGTGTGEVAFTDSNGNTTGNVIGLVPANATIGSYYTFDMPAVYGIVATNVVNGPVMTVSIV